MIKALKRYGQKSAGEVVIKSLKICQEGCDKISEKMSTKICLGGCDKSKSQFWNNWQKRHTCFLKAITKIAIIFIIVIVIIIIIIIVIIIIPTTVIIFLLIFSYRGV